MARPAKPRAGEDAAPLVQELLSAIPASCTWLLPVRDSRGRVADFRIAAASERSDDVYGRPGSQRVGALISELYPGMVDGPLWEAYLRAATDGVGADLADFQYAEKRTGVVADSIFEVSVRPACGGLLVWWQRVDETRRRLSSTELLGSLGWAEHDLATGMSAWSPGMYAVFERDTALGPLSRAEQSSAILAEDRPLTEAAWQTLDAGAMLDTTVRFLVGDRVKSLRIMSDIARDSDGTPLKIYAVVQDVTAREASRSAVERLSEELRRRKTTALAEHRLAGQLQNMIQPLPGKPFALPGLRVSVTYLPAEGIAQVGGDWYHAQPLGNGQVVLAIGDVVGHGLTAASSMAHLRYALIAWTSMGISSPGELLEHMNRLCSQLHTTATAIVAVFDPATRRLRWANAGHPSPLLTRNGRTRALRRPGGLLLGAVETTYPASTARLAPGDIVLFYTDGLVERRTGRARLPDIRRHLASAAASDRPLELLRPLLNEASPHDDTCALAVLVC
jgi:serine phosphatase RsbU (regulator of sigma subunit)